MRIMNLVSENIEIFTDKKALFERTFVKNAFLKKMHEKCINLDRNPLLDITKVLIEQDIHLSDLVQKASDTLGFTFEPEEGDEGASSRLKELSSSFRIVRDGSSFSSFKSQFKLPAILQSKDADKLSHLCRGFYTTNNMFQTGFTKVIKAEDFDVQLKVEEHSAQVTMKIENESGQVLVTQKDLMKGNSGIIDIPKGTLATISYPVYSNKLFQIGCSRCDEVKMETE
jgi:hypothetical protein